MVDREDGKSKPRCRDCGTQAWNARREITMHGFNLRVRLHFVCSSCGLVQCTERKEHPARLVLALAS
jgi:hypothetical protein